MVGSRKLEKDSAAGEAGNKKPGRASGRVRKKKYGVDYGPR
jgi:hypothetical protein